MTLPGAASHPRGRLRPRAHGRRMTGRRIVEMVWEDLKPSDMLTPEAFDNAITADMAHRRLDQRRSCT